MYITHITIRSLIPQEAIHSTRTVTMSVSYNVRPGSWTLPGTKVGTLSGIKDIQSSVFGCYHFTSVESQ